MIPLTEPTLSGREAAYLQECISTNFVSTVGPFVPTFEEMAAELMGFPHAVATNTGTSALHVALTALGVRADDLVVLPSYTFIATANAVRMCGAYPWFFDIEEDSWGIDPEVLAKEISANSEVRDGSLWHTSLRRRVAAVVAVCSVGQPPRLDEIVRVASNFDLPLLIDAAGAAGARYGKKDLGGTVNHVVLSFNGNKTFTAGGGGAFLTQDANLASRVRHLSTTARTDESYSHDSEAFNYRLTNIQAAVGCAQLEQADHFLERKRAIDFNYRSAWTGTNLMSFPCTEWAESACWMTGTVLPRNSSVAIEELVKDLRARGVESRKFWKPMHLQAPYSFSPRTSMSITDDLWPRVLTLPSSISLTDHEQEQVIAHVLNLMGSR